MDYFQLIKLAHILSATILFGTGLGTAFFMWQTDRSGNVQTIALVSRIVVLADWWFTLPAIVLQALTGFWMMQIKGYAWTEVWLAAAIILFVAAGVCWLPVVWLQIRMRDLTQAALVENSAPPPLYRRYMTIWFALGWPAFSAVLIIFYLMVYKPMSL